MRVLVCGSRKWEDPKPIAHALSGYLFFDEEYKDGVTVIEGAAPGADSLARLIAEGYGMEVLSFPADWNRYGKAAGPIRNQQMLDEGKPDEAWAFTDDITTSKGTRDMCERAHKAGVPVYVVSHYQPQTGFRAVREAVRAARGGDAPVTVQGYA